MKKGLTDRSSDIAAGDINANLYVGGSAVSESDPVPIDDIWSLLLVADETANDSDKVLTVPTDYLYQVMWIYVELTSTATVGDRQLEIQFRDDADDVIAMFKPEVVQAASLTYYYQFGPSMPDLFSTRDSTYVATPFIPGAFLPEDYDIRIWDNNAVDAAADDMVVQMMVARKDINL